MPTTAVYTLKYKSTGNPMLTFKAPFWKSFLEAAPGARTLAWAKLKKDLQRHFVNVHMNPDQMDQWLEAQTPEMGADVSNMVSETWYMVINHFNSGLMNSTCVDIQKNLIVANAFYETIENVLASTPTAKVQQDEFDDANSFVLA